MRSGWDPRRRRAIVDARFEALRVHYEDAADRRALARKVEDAYLQWYAHAEAVGPDLAVFRLLCRRVEVSMLALVTLSGAAALTRSENTALYWDTAWPSPPFSPL